MIASYILFIILNIGKKVYDRMITETLMLNHICHACEVFHDDVIFFHIGCSFTITGDTLRKTVLRIIM